MLPSFKLKNRVETKSLTSISLVKAYRFYGFWDAIKLHYPQEEEIQ